MPAGPADGQQRKTLRVWVEVQEDVDAQQQQQQVSQAAAGFVPPADSGAQAQLAQAAAAAGQWLSGFCPQQASGAAPMLSGAATGTASMATALPPLPPGASLGGSCGLPEYLCGQADFEQLLDGLDMLADWVHLVEAPLSARLDCTV